MERILLLVLSCFAVAQVTAGEFVFMSDHGDVVGADVEEQQQPTVHQLTLSQRCFTAWLHRAQRPLPRQVAATGLIFNRQTVVFAAGGDEGGSGGGGYGCGGISPCGD